MKRLDGKLCAEQILQEIAAHVSSLPQRKPALAFVLVGENPASRSYVQRKQAACAATGVLSHLIELAPTVQTADLLRHIDTLNRDPNIDGILVQLPLPDHIDETAVASAIDPNKDVDGFHPINMGKLLLGDESGFIPCTPYGVVELLARAQITVEGKHVVILGRGSLVGRPLAALLAQKRTHCNATVTVCHRATYNLSSITAAADILIAAIGSPRFVQPHMVKQGAVVIDVGITRTERGVEGDVDFKAVAPRTSYITPVPGGVGPMTIAMLLQNTLKSYTHSKKS